MYHSRLPRLLFHGMQQFVLGDDGLAALAGPTMAVVR
jgi:hypothetical protein